MNVFVELLKRVVPLLISLGNRVAALEEEESRESANDAMLMQEANALLAALTLPSPTLNEPPMGVPPMGIPSMPSDII
jgi:hypothetical protein